MPGGLLQLVAYGAQDAYLTGNPQITFWRGLYKRHTNFAMEPFRVNLTGQATWGTKHSAILGRHADLISSAYIEVQLKYDATNTLKYVPGDTSGLQGEVDVRGLYNLVDYVELDIGGQVIDRQYGEFMYLWSQLTLKRDDRVKLARLYGGDIINGTCNDTTGRPARGNVSYIPLSFYFARNPGAALPLIALQYHEVKINILWNKARLIFGNANVTSQGPDQANLLIDYVYLDVEERRRMAQESHEYLIEQLQFNEDKGITSAQNRIDLTFNHPVKELIWVTQQSIRRNCKLSNSQLTLSPLDYDQIIYDCSIQINGQDRLPSLPGRYYNTVQPFQHHSGVHSPQSTVTGESAALPTNGVYMYSFAIKPEEHQPSGTCNFSRIDTATIVFNVDGAYPINNQDANNYDIRVYAVNYNVLRVMSGMGGLAYSN
jgi:hypothetical protein